MFSVCQTQIMASQKKLKKFGKKMRKQRERDLNNMKNRLSEIADSEKKRSRKFLKVIRNSSRQRRLNSQRLK